LKEIAYSISNLDFFWIKSVFINCLIYSLKALRFDDL
jgi:hypothetical protein